jgi:methionine synthase II (cobalamin-independent)
MTGQWPSVRSTGIGSWPGTDLASAIKIAFAECLDLPYLPELPARGSHAQLIGRSTALLAGLFVDLQPAGWRLTDGSGREHRLAIATLRADLDLLEEHAQGYQGPFKVAIGGPWTLAASIERARGDLVLADHGARRDVGQSLAEGIAQLIAELRRRLPAVDYLVQLDEPLLPAVLAGSIATASGFSRHRPVDIPEVSAALRYLIDRVAAVDDTRVAVHCCAKGVPVALLDGAGAQGVFFDVDQLASHDWDAIATVLEKGHWIGMGALPTDRMLTSDQVARRVVGPIRDLGLEPDVAGQLLVTPSCGLAGLSESDALTALRTVRTAAAIVTEELVR